MSVTNYIDSKTPIIYIGFGSIIVDDPDLLTKTIVKAVQMAGGSKLVYKLRVEVYVLYW